MQPTRSAAPYPKRHPVKLTAAQMQALVGVYKRGDGGLRTIVVRDGKLYTLNDGGSAHELLASSANELYFSEVLDYFRVTRNPAGKVVALERFPSGEGPAEREPKLDEALPAIDPVKK